MYRVCIDEVCVRSSVRMSPAPPSPRIGEARYSVSCMSRAGCSAGMFSASKQCHSSSASGPSTTVNPMRVKMSSSWSRAMVNGCRWPSGGTRPGSVTSIAPAGGRDASSAARFSATRASMSVFRSLVSFPSVGRRSGGAAATAFMSAAMTPPLRARYRSRTAWRSRSDAAPASAASNSSRRRAMVVGVGMRSDTTSGRLRVCLCLLRQAGKRGRARDGELRQALAIERDAGVLQPVDQLAVGEAVLARGGVDADDPQAAEVAFLAAPAHERVLERGVARFFRGAIQLALVGVVTLRQAQQLLPLRPPDRPSFHTRHLELLESRIPSPDLPESRIPNPESLFVRKHPCELRRVDGGHHRRPAQPALPLRRLAAQEVLLERLPAQKLSVLRPLEALGRAAVCLQFRHRLLKLSRGRRGRRLRLAAAGLRPARQDGVHLIAFHPRRRLRDGHVGELLHQALEDAAADFRVRHLAPAEEA